jgi:CheY-like chemotaxis protein
MRRIRPERFPIRGIRGMRDGVVRLNTRILVIEDNPANLELMVYLLDAYGHQTMTAHDGLGGLALARRERPDLIICDVHLPGLNGYGVIAILKSEPTLCSIPVIAVTALAMVGDREKLLTAGFDGYISKPVEPERFVGVIEQFLKSSHAGASAPGRAPHFPQ